MGVGAIKLRGIMLNKDRIIQRGTNLKNLLRFWIPWSTGIILVLLIISLVSLWRNGELDLLLIIIAGLGGLIGGFIAFFRLKKLSHK